MFQFSYGVALLGMEVHMIRIEADVSDGLPMFSLVGLLGSEVKEAKDRVRISIRNSGYRLPTKRITINLSPADLRKEGTGYDLPIAVSILNAYGFLKTRDLSSIVFMGELSLDGKVKAVKGVLPSLHEAKKRGFRICIIPRDNQTEAIFIKGIKVLAVQYLGEVVQYLNGQLQESNIEIKRSIHKRGEEKKQRNELDYADVMGQENLIRAMTIAVAGNHNILMVGPPGVGKTMIAKRIPSIMPKPTLEESLEITKLYSIAGLLEKNQTIMDTRPFRSPHHTITATAFAGGGTIPVPGELSLASGGVLFLDELPEFKRATLEVLRQPLEEKVVHISRIQGNYRYPANFMLVAAMNPCYCGYYPNRNRCHCSQNQVNQYLNRISRPLLDRIDIMAEAIEVEYSSLQKSKQAYSSKELRKCVIKARKYQAFRYKKDNILYNSQLTPELIKKYCALPIEEVEYLKEVLQRMQLSTRMYHQILKVARTIADLEENEIEHKHLNEAIAFRTLEVGS